MTEWLLKLAYVGAGISVVLCIAGVVGIVWATIRESRDESVPEWDEHHGWHEVFLEGDGTLKEEHK